MIRHGTVPALLVLLVVALWSDAATPLSLSPSQRERLERGEIVLLDALPAGAAQPAQGGTGVALVRAPEETVWRVLVDYPRHRGLYPRVTEARVLEHDPGHALVRYTVEVGLFSFGFHVHNYPDAGRRRLDWRLAEGRANGIFRENHGYWLLEPHPGGVMLTYAIAARTVLPAFLTRGAERDGLVETLRAVRERAEAPPIP